MERIGHEYKGAQVCCHYEAEVPLSHGKISAFILFHCANDFSVTTLKFLRFFRQNINILAIVIINNL